MASGIRGSRATASGSDDEEGRSARYPARRAELDQSCQRGHDRGRQPGGTFVGEAIYAGLAPEDILVYVERGEGRRNRPHSKASTVAPNVTAFGKATQGGKKLKEQSNARQAEAGVSRFFDKR